MDKHSTIPTDTYIAGYEAARIYDEKSIYRENPFSLDDERHEQWDDGFVDYNLDEALKLARGKP